MLNSAEHTYDRGYLILTVVLIGLGLVVQYSASSSLAAAKFEDPGVYMRGHFIRIVIGVVFGAFFYCVNYQRLKSIALWIVFGAIGLLIVTLIYHAVSPQHSTARWIRIGPINLQTSEIAKFAIIVYLASFMDRRRRQIADFTTGFLPAAVILLIIAVLVIVEPDFSSGAVITLLGIILLFAGGSRIRYLSLFGVVFAPVSLYFIITSPYKVRRILTFIGHESDLRSAGYQIHQSLITLGNGGFWGRGLGGSIEKNLFLPDPHTDFIFSVIGEEFGFAGALVLLMIFLGLYICALKIAFRSPDLFGQLLGFGLATSMFLYVVVNVAVVCGRAPVTGLPLPFFSYGGSSMIYNLMCTGIILNLSKFTVSDDKTRSVRG